MVRRVEAFIKGGKLIEGRKLIDDGITELHLQGSTESTEYINQLEMTRDKVSKIM